MLLDGIAGWSVTKGHSHGDGSSDGRYHAVLLLTMSGSLADLLLWVLLRLQVKLQQSRLFDRVAALAAEEAIEQAAALQRQRQEWYGSAAAGALKMSRLRMARLLRINALKNIMLEDSEHGMVGLAKSLLGSSQKLDGWSKLNPEEEEEVAMLDLASRYPASDLNEVAEDINEVVGEAGAPLGRDVPEGGRAAAVDRGEARGPSGHGEELIAPSRTGFSSVTPQSSFPPPAHPPGARPLGNIPSGSSSPDLVGETKDAAGMARTPLPPSYIRSSSSSSFSRHQRSASDPTMPRQQQQQRQVDRGQAVAAIAASVGLPRATQGMQAPPSSAGVQGLASGRGCAPGELRLSDPRLTLLQSAASVTASTIGRTLSSWGAAGGSEDALRASGGGAHGSVLHSRVASSSSSRGWEAEVAAAARAGGGSSRGAGDRWDATARAFTTAAAPPLLSAPNAAPSNNNRPTSTNAVGITGANPPAAFGVGWSGGGGRGVSFLRRALAVLGSRGCQSTLCYSLYLFAFLCDYSLLTVVYPVSMLTWALLSQRRAIKYWKVSNTIFEKLAGGNGTSGFSGLCRTAVAILGVTLPWLLESAIHYIVTWYISDGCYGPFKCLLFAMLATNERLI